MLKARLGQSQRRREKVTISAILYHGIILMLCPLYCLRIISLCYSLQAISQQFFFIYKKKIFFWGGGGTVLTVFNCDSIQCVCVCMCV